MAIHQIFAQKNQALFKRFSGSGDGPTKRELMNKLKLIEYKSFDY